MWGILRGRRIKSRECRYSELWEPESKWNKLVDALDYEVTQNPGWKLARNYPISPGGVNADIVIETPTRALVLEALRPIPGTVAMSVAALPIASMVLTAAPQLFPGKEVVCVAYYPTVKVPTSIRDDIKLVGEKVEILDADIEPQIFASQLIAKLR